MDAERYERTQRLFLEAVDLPGPARQAYLARECGDDAILLSDVLRMLETDAGGDLLLDRDLAEVAGAVITEGRQLPDRLGPYRITGLLGEGGMGVVYGASGSPPSSGRSRSWITRISRGSTMPGRLATARRGS
jgi:hypothetical protein